MSLSGVLPLLQRRREFLFVSDAIAHRRRPWVTGPTGSAKACLIAAHVVHAGTAVPAWAVLTSNREQAERLADDLSAFLPAGAHEVHTLAAWEGLGPEDRPSVEAEGARQRLLDAVGRGTPVVVVAPPAGFLSPLPDPEGAAAARITFRAGDRMRLEDALARLAAGGYERTELVQAPGEVAVRGGLIDVFPSTEDRPVRVEWAGDEIESVRTFDPDTQRTVDTIDEATVLAARPSPSTGILLPEALPDPVCVLDEPDDVERQARALYTHTVGAYERAIEAERISSDACVPIARWEQIATALDALRMLRISSLHRPPADDAVDAPFGAVESFAGQMDALVQHMRHWVAEGRRIVVASRQAHRITELLAEHGIPAAIADPLGALPDPGRALVVPRPLATGFALDDLTVITDSEILGWHRRSKKLRWLRDSARLGSWAELSPGDLVVHVHHGIGVYRGLRRLALGDGERDYLHLEYAQGDALYVPTDQIALVQRYVGADGQAPQINRLGGTEWEREKRRVRERTREMARELLQLYAARERAAGHAFSPDTPWQREMEDAFEYEETPDQLKAIEDVKRDMEAPRPMDRLVCGDVGYGKTEVALRAAFKAVMDGRQAAVLVPTTLLAQQHYTVFRERFAAFPVRVEMLSRFRTPKEQKAVVEGVRTGAVDVLIGTHQVLNKAITFRALGLVIIDEEQRFGVTHKERLKQLRTQVDVLTLTATPIPRTLHMSLAGLRDLSVMETPPDVRQPIRTFIREDDPALVRDAIRRELERGGQIYVVHNRVDAIERAAKRVRDAVPEARVAVAHGQMPETELEQVMLDFLAGRYDVLVCTTIVEIGLDIPRVNTIVIEQAHRLGLAQLYQLRGRVGRADRQAYAYLLYPRHARLTHEAEQRLVAMREFVELGSGLRLAMRDLEIRGAGNLLGPEQHGHLAAVGFDLYMRLLEEAVREVRGERIEEAPETTVDLGAEAYLPEEYIAAANQRIATYRRLAETRGPDEVRAALEELRDRYGPLPEPARALGEIVRLRAVARGLGIAAISRDRDGILVRPADGDAFGERVRPLLAHFPKARWTVDGVRLQVNGTDFAEAARTVDEFLARLATPAHPGHASARGPAETGAGHAGAGTAGASRGSASVGGAARPLAGAWPGARHVGSGERR
ncbi:MAG TPA: transcription-repair coupling factor [bacterium]|nr:transcription-repair coupling factor [bacterium]